MLTNPNTLGLFEQQLREVTDAVHEAGGLVYGDGANLNAILGVVKPADMGFDCLHINVHKTFSTPHGSGRTRARARSSSASASSRFCQRRWSSSAPTGTYRARLRSTQKHRSAEGLSRPLRHPRSRLHVHPDARRGRAAHAERNGGPERELPAGAAQRRLRSRLRAIMHARVRSFGSAAEERRMASGHWTSPSGCWTSGFIRPRSTFR